MAIEVGKTYRHGPTGLPCTITEVNRVSGRMMGTLSDGRTVHDIGSHELQDLPAAAPTAPTVEEAPAETAPEDEAPTPGLMTDRTFRRRVRGEE